jgi:hypothetical protein
MAFQAPVKSQAWISSVILLASFRRLSGEVVPAAPAVVSAVASAAHAQARNQAARRKRRTGIRVRLKDSFLDAPRLDILTETSEIEEDAHRLPGNEGPHGRVIRDDFHDRDTEFGIGEIDDPDKGVFPEKVEDELDVPVMESVS